MQGLRERVTEQGHRQKVVSHDGTVAAAHRRARPSTQASCVLAGAPLAWGGWLVRMHRRLHKGAIACEDCMTKIAIDCQSAQ